MAPKRLLEDPPPASSSEDEEETEDDVAEEDEENGDSEGLEDEDEDENSHQNKKPKSNNTPVTKSLKGTQDQSASDSGDEAGSETESDDSRPSPSASAFTIKPIASKPMKDSVQSQKNSANRKLTMSPTKTVTGGVKRSRESDDVERKESKKNKVSNGQDEDLKRGSGAQRLWSGDDEVAILEGMIEYQSEKGADPWADMEAFYGFVKENLHADVSKDQLKNKIKRLKQKYQSTAEKGKNGEAPVLGKPHDSRLFDLSKKIWGASVTNGVDDSAKKKRKPTQSEPKTSASALPNGEINAELASPNSSFFDALLADGMSIPEGAASVMKEALPLIGRARTRELESKWRKLQEDEFKLYLKKVELVRDSAKLMLEAMKSSMS
ncbi:STOREKEEPER protein-like [Neltuma alba]|uniref:STOREKEEPER protein-like n=1 Tax=Neltuma alba TaxID=207710 RepID=UPI0010A3177C|nr:STOREKEEPER protein-like [Prosopis alba]XP_028796625.1 STOREKEEPER protein-like [Prosopis alba]